MLEKSLSVNDEGVYESSVQDTSQKNEQKVTDVSQAISIIAEALRTDPDYFMSWQANIAMSIYDEFLRIKEERGVDLAIEDIGGICNRGAKQFLNLLTK